MDGGNEWSFENERSGAIGVGGFFFSLEEEAFKNNRLIETGRGGHKRSFKSGACLCQLKFQKQLVLSYRRGRICTREPRTRL